MPSSGGIIASYSVVSCSRLPHEDVGKTVEEQSIESTEVTHILISPEKQAPVYRFVGGKRKKERDFFFFFFLNFLLFFLFSFFFLPFFNPIEENTNKKMLLFK